MNITRLILQNRHAVWALAIAAAIFGILAYFSLPMQLFPDTSPPVVSVITAWPGASAEDVAENLSRPLEEEFSSTEDVVEITSSSQDNMSMVTVEFDYGRDLDIAAVDIQNALTRVRGTLPTNIEESQVLKLDTGDRPVITLGVAADDLVAARRRVEDVWASRLQRIPGVAAVDVFGGAEEAIVIQIDRARLEAHGIPFGRVVEEVRTSDAAMPAGILRTERTQTSFRVESRAEDPQLLGNISLHTPDGSRVLLSDLAEIRRGSLDDDARFSIDGERSIALQVFKTEDANTVDVVERVTEVAEGWNERYEDVEFQVGEEDASFTEQSVDNLLSNVWQALLLASLIVFLFIGKIRASLVAVVSMPLSYGITFALMMATGTEFNMVTLSAVILAVGMVVDAAVVVLENIIRRREDDGIDAEEAAVVGTNEVRMPVLAGVATTVVVLVPILFLTGFVGKTFGPLARTLLFAFTSSVTVALVLVPVLSVYTRGDSRLDDLGFKLVRPFHWLMDRLRDAYLLLLSQALRFRVVAIVLAVGTFVGGVLSIRSQGMEVLPKMDSGSFFVSLETPSGSSLHETERVVQDVESLLAAEPEVIRVQSQIGFEQGMKTFSSSGAQGPTQGFMTATLTPRTEREESIWAIQKRVRDGVARIPGIQSASVREMGNTAVSTTAAPIVVTVSGPDSLVLDRLADQVVERLSQVPDVVDPVRNWRLDQKRVEVDVDEMRAKQMGSSPIDIARQMLVGSDGVDAGEFYGGQGATSPIRVRYQRSELEQPSDLLDFPILVPETGDSIPLRSVAELRETTGQALVTRKNFSPTVEVTASTRGRALSFITADVEETIQAMELPRDYDVVVSGDRDNLEEARSKLGGAFAISLLAVYLLLVAQLRSFVHPIAIMGTVPLSLAGVGGALWLTGKPVSMPVMIGMILLVGTVVNNAILLIDFIRQARERGETRRAAIEQSVATRFRPIMMTALSTTVGMIPLAAEWALGAERFSPLAIAVIGGLIVATFLTMIIIPVLYDLLEDLVEIVRRGRERLLGAAPNIASVLIAVMVVAGGSAIPSPASGQEGGMLELDVEEASEMARSHSHEVSASESRGAAAGARRKESRSRFLPRLQVTGRASKLSEVEPGSLKLPAQQPGMDPLEVQFGEPIDERYSLRVALSQPLFTGFTLWNGTQAATAAAKLADTRTEKARSDVELEVVEAYFTLYRARKLVEVADRSMELLRELLGRVERLAEAGRATRLDVSRVKSRLAAARVSHEEVSGAALIAERHLQTLIGVSSDVEIILTAAPAASSPGDDAKVVERAVESRPEILIAQHVAEVHEQQYEVARGALFPHLYLQAGYTLANPHDRYFPPRDEFNDSWDVSLVLSWNVSLGGGELHSLRAARHEADAARQQVRHLEEFTRLAVHRQLISIETAQKKVAAASMSVDTADEALRIALRLYEAGRVESTEVLQAETELTRARADEVVAQTELRVARARLDRLVGR